MRQLLFVMRTCDGYSKTAKLQISWNSICHYSLKHSARKLIKNRKIKMPIYPIYAQKLKEINNIDFCEYRNHFVR